MHMPPRSSAFALALVISAGIGACQSAGRLAEYDFPGSTLAAVYEFPPSPDVRTGPYFPDHPRTPAHAFLRLASLIAKEVAAADVRERLDSAGVLVDVAGRLTDRTSARAARLLRVQLSDDERSADFILEVRIRDYGIDAKEWDAAAHFFIDANVILLDGEDGSEIWESHVQERDPMAPAIFGPGPARVARDIVTAAVLSSMTEAEIAQALEQLADYAADRITERLQDSLEEVRSERRP